MSQESNLNIDNHLVVTKLVDGSLAFRPTSVVGARIITQCIGRLHHSLQNTRIVREMYSFIDQCNRLEGEEIPKNAFPDVSLTDLLEKVWVGEMLSDVDVAKFGATVAEATNVNIGALLKARANNTPVALGSIGAKVTAKEAEDDCEDDAGDVEAGHVNECAEQLCKIIYENLCQVRDGIVARYEAGEEIGAHELNWIVSKASDLTFKRGKETFIGKVTSHFVNDSFIGRSYVLQVRVIVQDSNNSFSPVYENLSLRAGSILQKDMHTLHLTTQEELEAMTARGRHICQTFFGVKYMQFEGALVRRSWYGDKSYNASGKVMVDRSMMHRMDPSYSHYFGGDEEVGSSSRGVDVGQQREFVLQDADYRYVSPVFYGFSFRAKMWGEFSLTGMSEVVYNADALEKVVLPQETKDIVRALVEFNHQVPSKDLVGEKGAGSSFLLYGTPGLGKTLLVEAVSEYLKKPLYRVTAGELGTAPDEVEEKLMDLLDMCTVWDANLLIDEADIFMETRQASDIQRNAIVSIFLRTIEYYHGNLFLTTNRKDQIDPAFLSRISLCIPFERQGENGRESVWNNLLGVNLAQSIIDKLQVKSYARVDLNNREIHHIIRLALVKAKSLDKEVGHEEFESIFRMRGTALQA